MHNHLMHILIYMHNHRMHILINMHNHHISSYRHKRHSHYAHHQAKKAIGSIFLWIAICNWGLGWLSWSWICVYLYDICYAIHTYCSPPQPNWRLWLSRTYASPDSIKLGASHSIHILPYTYFFCLDGIIHTQFSYGFMYTHTIFSYRSLCLLLIIRRVYAYS